MFRTGAAADPPGKAGLASLTAEMLDEGAGARDALAIAAELEQLGADLWVGSGRDGSQLSVQAPRETFQQAMAIAADVLARPRLGDADWRRVQADRRTGVVQRRDQPEAVVNVVSDRILFGDDHPYGQPVDGLERSIDALTLDDVRAFHRATTIRRRRRWSSPATSTRIRCATDWKRRWRAGIRARLAAAPAFPPWPARPRLVIVDRPGAPQSIVRLVAPGADRLSPDRPGMSMLNAVLGGSFTSRLNFNLREKNGFTYGAASSFAFLRHAGQLRGARGGVRRRDGRRRARDAKRAHRHARAADHRRRNTPRHAPRC